MKTQLTTIDQDTLVKECYVWNAKLYASKEEGEWMDKTPFLEIIFRDSTEHGAINFKMKLASYLTASDKECNLNEVRFSQDEFNYQINTKTGERIFNTLKTNEIELTYQKMLYQFGFDEGQEVEFNEIVGKTVMVTIKNGVIINLKRK